MTDTPADKAARRSTCLDLLKDCGLSYELVDHVECPTIDTLAEALASHAKPEDSVCKNLFMSDKKKKQFLIVADMKTLTHAKVLIPKLGASQPLRFASADRLAAGLKTAQGSVSPLSILNNEQNDVTLVMDDSLKTKEYLWIHPNDCTASLRVKREDLIKLIESKGKSIVWIDLSNAEAELAEAEANKGPSPAAQKKNVPPPRIEGAEMIGITVRKNDDFAEWYSQVITKAELIDYYDVSGCYVLRPSAFFMWEQIQNYMNEYIKDDDVDNCYFPMFVTKHALEKEKDHVEGFSPEVAWVTKSGDKDLAEPIAIRPTSETIMYPTFAKWIRSHRDLPVKVNQWCPIVRWEFKQPTPFIRTREFLWQEGHTAHATKEEAQIQVRHILNLYQKVYEDLLAVPVVPGEKSTKERFAGGDATTTVEAYIPTNGRAVQGATSHFLGQNFSKMFNITFEDEKKEMNHAYQTSWGFTTRSIGVGIMTHSDDKGLMVSPKVAHIQAVIVPVLFKDSNEAVNAKCLEIQKLLKKNKIRAKADIRDNYKPGWKYNHWELKGVPLRIDVGPKDLAKEQVVIVRRDTGVKVSVPWSDLVSTVTTELDNMYNDMFARAKANMEKNILKTTSKDDIIQALKNKKLLLLPWNDSVITEEEIKNWTSQEFQKLVDAGESDSTGGMKSLCFPYDQPEMPEGTKDFWTGEPATRWCLFGKSY